MKRSTAILSMFIIAVSLLALGCTGSNNSSNSSGSTATPAPTAINNTPVPSGDGATATAVPTIDVDSNISAAINTTNSTYIDPSIVDITNETDESIPNF